MRKIMLVIAGLVLLLSLTACGTKLYKVETHGGDTYTAAGEPEYDAKSDTYTFKDEKGAKYIVKKDDLKVIREELK